MPGASSCTRLVTQIPPASANASRRLPHYCHRILAPSTISPTLLLILNSTRLSGDICALPRAIAHCISKPNATRPPHCQTESAGHRLLSLRSGHVFFKLGLSELSIPLLERASRHSRRLPPRAGPTRGRAIEAAARAHPL